MISTYSMKIYVLFHFDIKMTLQSLSEFCTELRATGEYVKFDSDCDVI